jgi:hypothetical protein
MLHLQNHAMQARKGKAAGPKEKNAGTKPALSL